MSGGLEGFCLTGRAGSRRVSVPRERARPHCVNLHTPIRGPGPIRWGSLSLQVFVYQSLVKFREEPKANGNWDAFPRP
jgi:hypothetical protein